MKKSRDTWTTLSGIHSLTPTHNSDTWQNIERRDKRGGILSWSHD